MSDSTCFCAGCQLHISWVLVSWGRSIFLSIFVFVHVHWLWIEFDLSCLWYVASIIYWSSVLSLSVISMPAIASPLRGPAHLQTHMHTQRLLLSLFSWILAAMQVARVTAGISLPFSLSVCVFECGCVGMSLVPGEPLTPVSHNCHLPRCTLDHIFCVCVCLLWLFWHVLTFAGS